jgi:hypothetical protein
MIFTTYWKDTGFLEEKQCEANLQFTIVNCRLKIVPSAGVLRFNIDN